MNHYLAPILTRLGVLASPVSGRHVARRPACRPSTLRANSSELPACFIRNGWPVSGQRWDEWCQSELGLPRRTLDQYRTVYEHLGASGAEIHMPASWRTLYELARLRRDHPEVFDQAIAEGRINPNMTRQQAYGLYPRPDDDDDSPAPSAPRRALLEVRPPRRPGISDALGIAHEALMGIDPDEFDIQVPELWQEQKRQIEEMLDRLHVLHCKLPELSPPIQTPNDTGNTLH